MDYNENFQRFRISDTLYDSWTKNRQPYIATFELLSSCNLSCIHCYLGVHRMEPKQLTYTQVTHILDELKDAGVLQVALTGGECMLREDFSEIYEYAKKLGFLVTVFTNLTCLSETVLKKFIDYPPFCVEISLYGASEETYSRITGQRVFEKVMANIKSLFGSRIRFALKTPLIIQNSDDKGALEDIARSFGTDLRIAFAMSPTIDQELYPENFSLNLSTRFLHEISNVVGDITGLKESNIKNPWGAIYDAGEFVPQFICNPGVNDVFVDYKGYVSPCVAYRSKGLSLLEHSFQDIWDSFSCLKKMPVQRNYKCIRCESRYFCNICVAEQDMIHHDLCHIPKDVCVYAQARRKYYCEKKSISNVLDFIRESGM
jgi:Predicted Fe-S oxidoreductases